MSIRPPASRRINRRPVHYIAGAYSYIYGATSLRAIDFWIGQSAGALKPYFLDSYLGVFGHEVVAGVPDAGDNRGALLLYGVAFLFLLVGNCYVSFVICFVVIFLLVFFLLFVFILHILSSYSRHFFCSNR